MLNQKYFSANSVISAITGLIITIIILIACMITYFLTVLDNTTAEDIYDRVDMAFSIEQDQLLKLSIEYSFWDESYESTVAKHDKQWINDTYQDYLLPSYNLSYIALIKSDMTVELLAKQDSIDINPQDILTSSVLERVTATQQRHRIYNQKAFFTESDGALFVVSVEPYRNEETSNIVDGSHLVLAKQLNASYLDVLSDRYRLPKLTSDSTVQHDDSITLGGFEQGQSVGYLYWSTPRITYKVAPYMIIILFSFLVISVVLIRLLLKKDYRDRSKYQETLFTAATTDELTDVANRRYFMEFGEKEFQISVIQKQVMSLLILDLDHFKSINDTYGHAIGDAALKHFTKICKTNVRRTDLIGRIGGEEFAIILPGTDNEKSHELADMIRIKLSETPLHIDGKTVKLTVSVGTAMLTAQRSFEELLANADKALYSAKNDGCNTVKSFNTEA